MGVPYGKRIGREELRAPTGQFRVVMATPRENPTDFFNIGDHPEKYDAFNQWRTLLLRKRDRDVKYLVYNDEGRQLGVLGVVIAEEECGAPKGQYRIVCVDMAPKIAGVGPIGLYHVRDVADRKLALEYAGSTNEGPYVGFRVHDDTGAVLE